MQGVGLVTLNEYPGTITKILYHEPYEISGEWGQPWKSRMSLILPMAEIAAFRAFVGGTVRTVMTTNGPMSRIVPLSDPLNNLMLCTSLRGVGTGSYTASNGPYLSCWSHVKFHLEFSSVPFPIDGSSPFMTITSQTSSETTTAAGAKLVFSDGSPIQADAGISLPVKTINVQIHQSADTYDSVCDPLTGLVNSVAVVIAGVSRDIGTVYFGGQGSETIINMGMMTTYTRNLQFKWRPIPWNQFLRRDFVWDYAIKPDSSYVYAEDDMRVLFQ